MRATPLLNTSKGSKAFIAASNDHLKGVHQKVHELQAKMENCYKQLRITQEKQDAAQCTSNALVGLVSTGGKNNKVIVSYPHHTGSSLYQTFIKKISPAVQKWTSILHLTSDGEPNYKSGKDYAKYIEQMQTLYANKFGNMFDFIECWEFLSQEPKWADWVQKKEMEAKKEKKKCPTGTKKFKEKQKEKELIDTVMERAGIGITSANPIFLDGINDGNGGMGAADNPTGSLLGSKSEDQHFAEVMDCLKQIVTMGSQFMLGAMMGITPENTSLYASEDKKCQFVQAQVCMRLAQLKKDIIDIEEENECHRKKLKESNKTDEENPKSVTDEQDTANVHDDPSI